MGPRLVEKQPEGMLRSDGTVFIPFGSYNPNVMQITEENGRIQKYTFDFSGVIAVHIITANLLFLQDHGEKNKALVELLFKAATRLEELKESIAPSAAEEVFTLELTLEEVIGRSNKGLLFKGPEEAIEFIKVLLGHPGLRFGPGFFGKRREIIETINQTAEALRESL